MNVGLRKGYAFNECCPCSSCYRSESTAGLGVTLKLMTESSSQQTMALGQNPGYCFHK